MSNCTFLVRQQFPTPDCHLLSFIDISQRLSQSSHKVSRSAFCFSGAFPVGSHLLLVVCGNCTKSLVRSTPGSSKVHPISLSTGYQLKSSITSHLIQELRELVVDTLEVIFLQLSVYIERPYRHL